MVTMNGPGNRVRAFVALLAVLAPLVSGCAHGLSSQTRTRILAVTGAGAMVIGGVVASGCGFDESGCESPSEPNLGAGIGLVGVGSVLLGAALLTRSPTGPLFPPPPPSAFTPLH